MNTFIQNHVKGGGNEMPVHPMLYTVKQAAYLLGIKTTTMYAQINARKIRVCKVGTQKPEYSKVTCYPKTTSVINNN